MSYSGSGNAGGAWRNGGGVPPHAFDPWTQPELFRGLLTRRGFRIPIHLGVLLLLAVLAFGFIPGFAVITLGLGWLLFLLVGPTAVSLGSIYSGWSSGRRDAIHVLWLRSLTIPCDPAFA